MTPLALLLVIERLPPTLVPLAMTVRAFESVMLALPTIVDAVTNLIPPDRNDAIGIVVGYRKVAADTRSVGDDREGIRVGDARIAHDCGRGDQLDSAAAEVIQGVRKRDAPGGGAEARRSADDNPRAEAGVLYDAR